MLNLCNSGASTVKSIDLLIEKVERSGINFLYVDRHLFWTCIDKYMLQLGENYWHVICTIILCGHIENRKSKKQEFSLSDGSRNCGSSFEYECLPRSFFLKNSNDTSQKNVDFIQKIL